MSRIINGIRKRCPNNQMRDIFFEEVETDDPVAYVVAFLKGKAVDVSMEQGIGGAVTVHATCDGLIQRFVFTPI